MNDKAILALVLFAGCSAGDVQPPDNPGPGTDGGYGDTGGTDGTNPDECWGKHAPADAVRWQCEGLAEATIRATIDVDIPDWIGDDAFIRQVIDAGRLDWNALFGPWNDEGYDEPGIDACCLPTVGGADEDGEDETGEPPPGEDQIPQAAVACSYDCADQACRSIPGVLRDLALEVPGGVPLIGPSYRKQLRELANWVALNQEDCYDSMADGGVREQLGAYIVDGVWEIPNSEDWPNVTDLSVDGQCKVFDWYLPAEGEPEACTGINDNNGEDPFGSGSLGGFDSFAPVGGEMELDGPVLLGVHAAGTAPILGLGDPCPRQECSRVDAWIVGETLELQRMLLVAPSSMSWEQAGMELTVDGLHVMVEHPRSIPLVDDDGVLRFELPAGELEVLVAGEVHGVPLKVTVSNVTPLTGTVVPLSDGSHVLTIDEFSVEHSDVFGSWTLDVSLGEFIALEHAPRAGLSIDELQGARLADASASFDPDGDPLSFEWFLDGVPIGEGPQMTLEPPQEGLSTLALRVSDDGGRSSWSYGLLASDE